MWDTRLAERVNRRGKERGTWGGGESIKRVRKG